MHPSAMANGKLFFETYTKYLKEESQITVVEIGSQNVNGSLRDVCNSNFSYIGLDFESGHGVDVVLEDAYSLPLDSESIDVVVSSSCFEHSEFFWLTFLEVQRILKPNGLFYLNVPSAGNFHRYPVDCWRFFPDSGKALVSWANRNDYKTELLESYTQVGGSWQDFVAVFIKDSRFVPLYPDRIINIKLDFENGYIFGDRLLINPKWISQNDEKVEMTNEIAGCEHIQ